MISTSQENPFLDGSATSGSNHACVKNNSQSFRTIFDLFAAQAQLTPEIVAVSCGDHQITYQELSSQATALARKLRLLGVRRGSLVAICMERSIEMVIGLLGILKAGAAYVPLDPGYPKERLAYMLDDSDVPLLVTQPKLSALLPSHNATVLYIDKAWQSDSTQATDSPLELTQDDLAYVIYTSGSTGGPKGAMNTHGGIFNRLLWMQDAYHLSSEDRVLQKTPCSFDVSVWEFFWPLIAGARLVLAQPGGHQDSRYLVQVIQKEKITTIHFVPSMLNVFLDETELENCRNLKRVICSGEALPPHLQEMFFQKFSCELYNLYGPTEVAVDVTAWQCQRNNELNVVPIGRAISNIHVHVLDKKMKPVAPVIVGELYIAGIGLARGYWRRPELTAETFVPDPLSLSAGQRLYRTGDLGRHLPGGILEFLGRNDSQVKIRGVRIELGEIEAALVSHSQVKAAAVLAVKDHSGELRLAAYVVEDRERSGGSEKQASAAPGFGYLHDFLKDRLPAQMLPSAYILLERMPASPNGKLDRNALPRPENWIQQRASYTAPRNSHEKRIAQMWESLLGVEQVGTHDDFFDLGGHSLIATQFLGQLRQELKIGIPFQAFFAAPTIAGISAHLRQASELPAEQCHISPVPRRGIELPLSFSQERVWFLYRLHPGNLAYNFQSLLRFRGKFSLPLLERALSEVIRRHEIFRTTFHENQGRLAQKIHEPYKVSLPIIDLSQSIDPEQKAQAVIDAELQKNFDLQHLPLIYWVIIRIAPEEHLLFHKEHHLVHDGWSFNCFLYELFELYRAWHQGATPQLPELPIQFADFAFWQRGWLQTAEAASQLEYWRRKLSGAPELTMLPGDHPRPPAPSYKGGLIRIDLPLNLCRALRRRSREDNATLYMTMFAAFAILVHRLSGQTDVCVGSGVANRRWKETHPLIGMTVNNVVMRCDLSGNPTVRALLQQVREMAVQAYDNQDVPFDRVVEAIHPKRSLSYHPLYQLMFSFHDSPIRTLSVPECEVTLTEALGSGSAKWDMNVNVIPRAEQGVGDPENKSEGITLLWEYSSDLFEMATMEHWLAAYRNLLATVAADPDQQIEDLPLLAAEESDPFLDGGSGPTLSSKTTIHAAFDKVVKHAPQATAVVYRDQQLSYEELRCKANQVARHLMQLGIGPEVRVGICVERGLDMVVGILGVLKAGGAYVPMDPAHPSERLGYVMEDAAIGVILTQQRLRRVLPRHTAHVICLDDTELLNREAKEDPGTTACAENVAYVIYTSGSTGRPKGVEITHGNVLRLFTETQHWFNFGPQDVWTLFHSYAFDFSVWELWGALLYGGRVVVVPKWIARSSEEFWDLLVSEKVTVLNQTPSAFQQLITVEQSRSTAGDGSELALHWVIFGGEALDFEGLRPWLKRHPDGPQLVNMYGITESTVHVTYHSITYLDLEQPVTGSRIGVPIGDLRVYVLDHLLRPVPVGTPAELYISGNGLAKGYLKRPGLTAERFVPNPFGRQPGERLYRSGDLARYRSDGPLEYLGRIDDQVKIRGYRIELGEIEATLNRHPAVRESAVALLTEGQDKRLAAYVVLRDNEEFPQTELKEYLQQHLPDYMVPQHFVRLEQFPLTHNGKLDRAALPSHGLVMPRAVKRTYVAPETQVQKSLAHIWVEVLHLERAGIQDNFFELGGHSLLGMQVISRVRELYDVTLPLRSIFEQGTIAQLSEIVQSALLERVASLSEEEAQRLLENTQLFSRGA